ncbi:unnamed protein product [Euphydryas editha]|uniref:Uncharacterized protein n=1 Tax=Euphydryas editha TaxID=104508 RepID=A0AAU9VCE3_EUPED|nr:unnamed protein product [Euphydryas editha]
MSGGVRWSGVPPSAAERRPSAASTQRHDRLPIPSYCPAGATTETTTLPHSGHRGSVVREARAELGSEPPARVSRDRERQAGEAKPAPTLTWVEDAAEGGPGVRHRYSLRNIVIKLEAADRTHAAPETRVDTGGRGAAPPPCLPPHRRPPHAGAHARYQYRHCAPSTPRMQHHLATTILHASMQC